MTFDVAVIGAGISGASAALEIATSGLRVVLIDRYAPAAMASGWTLAGVRQSGRHPAELPLAIEAVKLWQDLAERIDGPTHYRQRGNLRCARDAGEVSIIERLIAEQGAAGLEMIRLDGRDVQAVAPAVSEAVVMASYCPTDGQADPRTSVASIVRAAERAGAALRFGERVTAIEVEGGRVQGVRTEREFIPAARVVLAAGIYGNELLEPLGLRVPMEVMMVTMINSVPLPPVLEQVVGTGYANGSGRQEVNGRFRGGSGHEPWHGAIEDAGGTPVVRPPMRSVQQSLSVMGELIPAFREAPIESIWAGLIDQTPDALPVLDTPAAAEGLAIAMGFSGHGFCLGPLTGQILCDMVHGRTPAVPLGAFSLARFDGWNGPVPPLTLHG